MSDTTQLEPALQAPRRLENGLTPRNRPDRVPLGLRTGKAIEVECSCAGEVTELAPRRLWPSRLGADFSERTGLRRSSRDQKPEPGWLRPARRHDALEIEIGIGHDERQRQRASGRLRREPEHVAAAAQVTDVIVIDEPPTSLSGKHLERQEGQPKPSGESRESRLCLPSDGMSGSNTAALRAWPAASPERGTAWRSSLTMSRAVSPSGGLRTLARKSAIIWSIGPASPRSIIRTSSGSPA